MQNISPGSDISWLGHSSIKEYNDIPLTDIGKQAVVIVEMNSANMFLSGMGLRNSYPTNRDYIRGDDTWDRVETVYRSLFRGHTEYEEVARFDQGYFMPDYRVCWNRESVI